MKRSITLAGHKTSVTLEDEFWRGMRLSARNENAALITFISHIDSARQESNKHNWPKAATNEALYSGYRDAFRRALSICSAHAGLRDLSGASTSPGCFATVVICRAQRRASSQFASAA